MKTFKLLILAGVVLTACKQEPTKEAPLSEDDLIAKATEIHHRVLTLDTHIDININNFTDSINYSQELENQVNLPKMKKGGLDVAWFIVYTGQGELNDEGYANAYKQAMSKFEAIHKLTNEIAPNDIELAVTSEEVRSIDKKGKKVAMIGIENGYPVGTDVSRVKQFYDLGARYMSLSHNGHSQLCDSNTGEEEDIWLHNGVSDLGKEVIAEMNKWGMMIDVSHPSKKSMKDMIELSKAPIIASHSSARALCDHSRNLDDEQLMWLKENGGVVQTVAFKTYVNKVKQDARNEKIQVIQQRIADSLSVTWITSWADYGKLTEEQKIDFRKNRNKITALADDEAIGNPNIPENVNVADFVDHIDYLVEKIGLEHVGISSDFDGGGGVEGWNDASETVNVTIELVKRGYTEAQIEALWSGNLLRVLDEVQKVAQEIQTEA